MTQQAKQLLSEDILNKAMNLFWEKGYTNTSVDDIIMTTGLNRTTLYKYFGGKNKFFLEMLERFHQTVTYTVTLPLQNETDGINGIRVFFSQFIELYDTAGLCSRGCFIIATASDIHSHDKHVVHFIQTFIVSIRASFSKLLTYSRREQSLKLEVDIDSITDFLVGNLFGLMTLGRASVPKQVFDNHIHGITYFLSTLNARN